MKKILLICSLLLTMAFFSVAQDVKYQYCQLIGERKLLSGVVAMHLDMGVRYKPTEEEQKLVDELENYESTTDALNRMAQSGWEPLMVVNAPNGASGSLVIHTMRKKK